MLNIDWVWLTIRFIYNLFFVSQQDRAKSATVIVVGCHSMGVSDRMRRNLTTNVLDYYKKRLPFYPEIAAVKFVTIPKLDEDIAQLCKCFYDTAGDHKMSLG